MDNTKYDSYYVCPFCLTDDELHEWGRQLTDRVGWFDDQGEFVMEEDDTYRWEYESYYCGKCDKKFDKPQKYIITNEV